MSFDIEHRITFEIPPPNQNKETDKFFELLKQSQKDACFFWSATGKEKDYMCVNHKCPASECLNKRNNETN